ncbi:MAG: Crp/Fnr family transcriptional regulator [Candidatus Acidiferrales bacterium]
MGRPAYPTDHRSSRSPEQTNTKETSLKNKILLAIPDLEYELIQSHLEPFQFRQQSVLHEPTQKLEFAYFPNHGLISLLVATEDGKTVEAGMVGSEGVAGVASAVGLTISPLRHVVQIPGDGFRIKVSALQNRLKFTPQLQMALSRYAVVQGMQVAQTAACNRLHEVGERLARWLLMAADRVDSNSLPITHDFLATSLGTDRPSVSLAAKILQRKKIIQYHRGVMEILSRKKLEASACECYKVIRQFNGMLRLK